MNKIKARKKAFTLVELAVAMAVTVVFLALVSVLLTTVLKEKERVNEDALISYELLLVESRVESWYNTFSAFDRSVAPCVFTVDGNRLVSVRDDVEQGWIEYDADSATLISSDRDRVIELKEIVDVQFEVKADGSTVVMSVYFESLTTPIVQMFTLKGVAYA